MFLQVMMTPEDFLRSISPGQKQPDQLGLDQFIQVRELDQFILARELDQFIQVRKLDQFILARELDKIIQVREQNSLYRLEN